MSHFGAENNLKLQFFSYIFFFFPVAINLHINFVHLYFLFSENLLSQSKVFSMSGRLRLSLFFQGKCCFCYSPTCPLSGAENLPLFPLSSVLKSISISPTLPTPSPGLKSAFGRVRVMHQTEHSCGPSIGSACVCAFKQEEQRWWPGDAMSALLTLIPLTISLAEDGHTVQPAMLPSLGCPDLPSLSL